MTGVSHQNPAHTQSGDRGLVILGSTLALLVMGIVAAVALHRNPHTVLVLATSADCLRLFDDTTCQAIVDAALIAHAKSAPRFRNLRTCELRFGAGQCRDIPQIVKPDYAPEIAVILASREDALEYPLPLYFGPKNEKTTADGQRRVYFSGKPVGLFSDAKFGGAELSRVTGLDGVPMTGEDLDRLRKR